MKKNLKFICGLLCVLSLFVLSFVVVNDNSVVAQHNTRVEILRGNNSCQWTTGIDFGTSTVQNVAVVRTGSTGFVAGTYLAQTGLCSVQATTLTGSSFTSGSSTVYNKIPANKIEINVDRLVRSAGNLDATTAISSYTGIDTSKTIYVQSAGTAGSGKQTIHSRLTIPALTPAGTYTGNLIATATPST